MPIICCVLNPFTMEQRVQVLQTSNPFDRYIQNTDLIETIIVLSNTYNTKDIEIVGLPTITGYLEFALRKAYMKKYNTNDLRIGVHKP